MINKNNESITFRFNIHKYEVKENGQVVTKVIQTGLGVFAKILDGYLTGIGADRHLNKVPDNYENDENGNWIAPPTTVSNPHVQRTPR